MRKIEINDVSKSYKLYEKKTERIFDALFPYQKKNITYFKALDGISMSVDQGEVIALVGRNGSGKSTLLKIIANISQPSSGTIDVNGDVVPLLGTGTGFHPELSGLDNLYYYLIVLGFKKQEVLEIMKEAIEFVDIGKFIHQPLKTYSKGMGARLAVAVNMFINPDILLVDEALATGDEQFKNKSIEKMNSLFKEGRTIFFVSHSQNDVLNLCSRAIFLHKGKLLMDGAPKDVLKEYNQFNKKK